MGKRVLVVNKFYYPRGGDCIYSLNLEALLRSAGFEVGVYAMQYPENADSEFSKYFAPEVSFAGGMGAKLSAACRTLGLGDIKWSFERAVKEFRPDVVHLNNIHSYLSPVVAEIAKRHGCRVVWTLHDYKLLCPSYSCMRGGKPCELCFDDKSGVLRNRCMKGSLAASAIAYVEAKRWNRKRLERCTDIFICPSGFMARKMEQGGFDKSNLRVLCNFISTDKIETLRRAALRTREDYFAYVGRLSEEKGVRTLLKAAKASGLRLKLAGGGPLADELRKQYSSCSDIEFLGMCSSSQVVELLGGARFSVMPSECYENNPLSVIESLCCGTPVVGAKIGGIPELIGEASGVSFEWGDAEDLRKAIEKAWAMPWDNGRIKEESLLRFSPEKYLDLLGEVYEK